MALPAKLTPPETGSFFARAELFRKLSELITNPRKVWISSPGGVGKTTLIRTFLANDPRPLVWYQVDHGDRDPANLFIHLSMAMQQHTNDIHLENQGTERTTPPLQPGASAQSGDILPKFLPEILCPIY